MKTPSDGSPGRRCGAAARRGMTLLEAAFAAVVLCIGVLAIFGMMNRVDAANRSVAFQRLSLDVLARVSAEIRDARCDARKDDPSAIDDLKTDTGIVQALANGGGWVSTSFSGSGIRTVGNLGGVPPLEVSYRVAAEVPPGQPPALDFDVRIREIQHDPSLSGSTAEDTYWAQTFPVKKLCNARVDTTARGEY